MNPTARALGDEVLAEHAALADADLDPAVLGDPTAVRLLLDRLTGYASWRSA